MINVWEAVNTWDGGTSVPDAPVISAGAGDSLIAVLWSAVANATGYKTYLDGVPTDVGNVTSQVYLGLNNGQEYEVFVVAYNANGDSPDSNKINLTPQEPMPSDDGMIRPIITSIVKPMIK